MLNNLFAKTFKIAFLLIIIIEILSFWAHQLPLLNLILFILICLITLGLAVYKLEYGFYVLLTELFIGSKGYLFFGEFDAQRISIRIGLFIVIFLVWFIKLLTGKHYEFFKTKWLTVYLILLTFIILGAVNGVLNNCFAPLFFDVNGWLYIFMVPVFFAVIKNEKVIGNILSILFASISYLSLKTLALLLIFVHKPPLPLPIIYQWVRNSGVGEITFASVHFYRVFFQAHIYVLIGLMIALTFLILGKFFKSDLELSPPDWFKASKKWLWLVAILSSITIIASLSRSFWVGLFVALLFLLILLIVKYKFKFRQLAKIILMIILVGVLEVAFLYIITGNLSFTEGALTKRLDDPTEEAAGSSRLQQLQPLWSAVSAKWFFGSGFGKEVTYTSDDPRIRERFSDGRYTTYAFEWGYLDIWLKIGLVGLLAYLCLIATIVKNSFGSGLLGVALLIGLVSVIITSIFSPYLNHPLGIGFIILISALMFYAKRNP